MLGKTVYAEPAARVGLSAELGLDPTRLQQTFNQIQPNSLILTPQLLELFCLLVEIVQVSARQPAGHGPLACILHQYPGCCDAAYRRRADAAERRAGPQSIA